MRYKGIIFDFNGVVVDDYPIQKQVWSTMSMKLKGKPVTDEEMFKRIRGVPTKETLMWLAGKKLDETTWRELGKEKENLVKEGYAVNPKAMLAKGIEVFLDLLVEKKTLMTIASSSSPGMFEFYFKVLKLGRWFNRDLIVCNDGKHKGQPEPDAYLLAAKKLKLKPQECVVFEDAEAGIIAAQRAGIGKIIAVGSQERLKKLMLLPGVKMGIRDFRKMGIEQVLE
jgi:HAD superfamily hydrolase (TIGR01509 family)